jgi:hypothetical protein
MEPRRQIKWPVPGWDALDKVRVRQRLRVEYFSTSHNTILVVYAALNMAVDKVSGAKAVDDRVEACVL